VGEFVGDCEGANVGNGVGEGVGEIEGVPDVGETVGALVGIVVGQITVQQVRPHTPKIPTVPNTKSSQHLVLSQSPCGSSSGAVLGAQVLGARV